MLMNKNESEIKFYKTQRERRLAMYRTFSSDRWTCCFFFSFNFWIFKLTWIPIGAVTWWHVLVNITCDVGASWYPTWHILMYICWPKGPKGGTAWANWATQWQSRNFEADGESFRQLCYFVNSKMPLKFLLFYYC